MPDNVNGDRQLPDQALTTPSGAPEGMNREQEDAEAQAQTVADDAIRGLADDQVDGETDKAPSGDAAGIVPEDTQDVVDHMKQMERSGRIDYDAYRGERNDDDETSTFGAHEPDDHTLRLTDE